MVILKSKSKKNIEPSVTRASAKKQKVGGKDRSGETVDIVVNDGHKNHAAITVDDQKQCASDGSKIASLVTPVKLEKGVEGCFAVITPLGKRPLMVTSSIDLSNTIENLTKIDLSFEFKSFDTVAETTSYFVETLQAFVAKGGLTCYAEHGKNIAAVATAKVAPAQTDKAEKPVNPYIASLNSLSAQAPANGTTVREKSLTKDQKMDELRKKLSQGEGTESLRVSYVINNNYGKAVYGLDLLTVKGDPYWQFKANVIPDVLSCTIKDIPGLPLSLFDPVHIGSVRVVPFGANKPRSNPGGYEVYNIWGMHKVHALQSNSIEDSMLSVGQAFKKVFANRSFRDFYVAGVAVTQEKLSKLISKNADKGLWNIMSKAIIDVKEKSSLDAIFCDETIKEIMYECTNGKDPSDWDDSDIQFAYSSGEIPTNLLQM
jgi:hypothetical protein